MVDASPSRPTLPSREGVEVRELRTSIGRRRGWLIVGAIAGAALAVLVNLVVPPRYVADTTVLVREFRESGAGALGASNAGGPGVMLGGIADMLSLDATLDTEIAILESRSVVGAVVDSLGLQVEVRQPRDATPERFFAEWRVDERAEERTFRIVTRGDGLEVRGPDAADARVLGRRVSVPGADLVVRHDLPAGGVAVRIRGRSDAIRAAERRLDVEVAGGQVVRARYRAADPALAAAVPNALVGEYLHLRQTSDRGVNRRRFDFLREHADSLRQELAAAETILRETQAEHGMLDPEFQGEEEVARVMELHASLEENEIELRALSAALTRTGPDDLRARDLAGFPTLLANPSVNAILTRLYDLEGRRTELLDRRTDTDPDVRVVERRIDEMETELASLIRSYHGGLVSRDREIRHELDRWTAAVDALPARAQTVLRAGREVERLSRTMVAIQTELVQARLGAIAEGGDVRLIDPAEAPRRPVFPILWLNLALGTGGGFFFAAALAAVVGYARRRVHDPWEAEAATGLPAVWIDGRRPIPLAAGGSERPGTIAIVPASAPAGRITASGAVSALANRGVSPAVARFDRAIFPESPTLEGPASEWIPDGPVDASSARTAVRTLRDEHELVVLLFSDLDQYYALGAYAWAPVAILAVPAGGLSHEDLQTHIVELQRAGARPMGIVLERSGGNGPSAPVLRRLLRAGRA